MAWDTFVQPVVDGYDAYGSGLERVFYRGMQGDYAGAARAGLGSYLGALTGSVYSDAAFGMALGGPNSPLAVIAGPEIKAQLSAAAIRLDPEAAADGAAATPYLEFLADVLVEVVTAGAATGAIVGKRAATQSSLALTRVVGAVHVVDGAKPSRHVLDAAEYIAREGRDVFALKEDHAGRAADLLVDGVGRVEVKTPLPDSKSAKTVLNEAQKSLRRGSQAPRIFVDARNSSITASGALRAAKRLSGILKTRRPGGTEHLNRCEWSDAITISLFDSRMEP